MARHTTDMQRRHYELIARVIRELPIDDVDRVIVATDFAYNLLGTNANFDKARFLAACAPSKAVA